MSVVFKRSRSCQSAIATGRSRDHFAAEIELRWCMYWQNGNQKFFQTMSMLIALVLSGCHYAQDMLNRNIGPSSHRFAQTQAMTREPLSLHLRSSLKQHSA